MEGYTLGETDGNDSKAGCPHASHSVSTIVRRRASRTAFPRWSVRNDHRNYRATLRLGMPLWTLCVLFATQSVENCIPMLERAERSSQLSCDAPRRMPFRTLCVLFATQGVES